MRLPTYEVTELSAAELNLLESRLEDRFSEEADRLHPRWIEFVARQDADDLARIVSLMLKPETPEATLAAHTMRDDYVKWRLATAHREREDEVRRMIRDEVFYD